MVYDTEGNSPVKTTNVDDAARDLFCITDDEVEELARMAVSIETHYGRPMDIEWAKDGIDGKLYIVQARPETVKSRSGNIIERYDLKERGRVEWTLTWSC